MKHASLLATKLAVRGLIVGAVLLAGGVVAWAWTGPGSSPPSGNVDSPINAGSASQVKSGALQVNGFLNSGSMVNYGYMSVNKTSGASYPLDVSGTVNAGTYCINGGNCISSWPSGGGGSGSVTSVSPGTGMSFSTITTSGSVSLNTGGISSCTNGTTNKIYWNGSQLVCGTDQTGGGSGTVSQVNSGTGLTGGPITTSGTLSVDTNSIQRRLTSGCGSGQAIQSVDVNGNVSCVSAGGGSTPTLDQVVAAGNSTSRSVSFSGTTLDGSVGATVNTNFINLGDRINSTGGTLSTSGSGSLQVLNAGGLLVNGAWGGGNLHVTGNGQIDGSLTVNGNTNSNGFFYNSDRSLKTNIQPLSEDASLANVLKLQGVSFDWKKDGSASVGVIAQDVEQVYPQLVHTDPKTGLKSVEYGNLVAPLIEAVKAQQKEIDQLKTRINELEASR